MKKNELMLRVSEVGKDLKKLDDIISMLPAARTEELVTGFRIANSYTKQVEKFSNAVKKELIDNKTLTGRFIQEGYGKSEDAKKHLYLEGFDGTELKAERRETITFNKDKAEEVLNKYDCYFEGVSEVVGIQDINKGYKTLVEVADALNDITKKSVGGEVTVSTDFIKALVHSLEGVFTVNLQADEFKIESLIAHKRIPSKEAQNFMDIAVQYAIKDGLKKGAGE